jgi:hypothetical protein
MGVINRFFISFLFLIPCLSSSEVEYFPLTDGKFTTLWEVYYFVQHIGRKTDLLLKNHNSVKFLINYYKADPLKCLNEAFGLVHLPFEEMLFTFTLSDHGAFYMPFSYSSIENFLSLNRNCEFINEMVPKLFLNSCKSKREMNKSFQIVRKLIKFINRYQKMLLNGWPGEVDRVNQLSSDIDSWNFLMSYLSSYPPYKRIDYFQFFSTFHGIFSFETFDFYVLTKKRYYLPFAIFLQRIIETKDIQLFDVTHRKLPLLVGILLNMIDRFGKSIFKDHTYSNYSSLLHNFFGKAKFRSLAKVIKGKKIIVHLAKKALGLDHKYPISLSLLIDSLERIPLVCQSGDHHNIFWQLKGVALIKEFLCANSRKVHQIKILCV